MTNAIKNYNSTDPTTTFKIPFPQSETHCKVEGLLDPIFKKIKELSFEHLGSSTYLIANKEDTVIQKVLKVSGWIFWVSPMILMLACLYDLLSDLYHENVENYSKMEKYSTEMREELSPQADNTHLPINEEIRDSSKALNNQEELEKEADENSFEIKNMSHELHEQMNNVPKVTSYPKSLWETLKTFNPFQSKTWNVVTHSDSTNHENTREPSSYKDFEMIDPITVSHETTKIDTTAVSIDQIKKEFTRMKIFINGSHCLNIQDFVNHLNLTLNTDQTDILPGYNPVIPKILHFSHQGLLQQSYGAFQAHVMQYSHKYPAQVTNREDKPLAIHINWNAEFPEETQIIGEVSFHVKSDIDGSSLPYIYTVKTRCSLDKEEISWEAAEEIAAEPLMPQDEIESSFVMVDSSDNTGETEQSDDDYTMIGSSTAAESDNQEFEVIEEEEIEISNSNTIIENKRDIAFKHLKDQINSCLTSTVTSEYLKSLEIKYPDFVFNDCLMLPVSITTDEIANSLNNLKNNTSNQLIFLPFLVNGWSVDHAVVAVINLSNETIEYFDPKGQSFIWPTRKEKQSNKDVFDFLTEIGQKVISSTFSRDKILYNKKNIPQGVSDNINCGAFCLQFIEKRITRSFDSIEDDAAIDPTELRRQLANKLIQNTYSN